MLNRENLIKCIEELKENEKNRYEDIINFIETSFASRRFYDYSITNRRFTLRMTSQQFPELLNSNIYRKTEEYLRNYYKDIGVLMDLNKVTGEEDPEVFSLVFYPNNVSD